MANENTFEINSQPIVDDAEELTLAIIRRLKDVARRLVNNPDEQVRINEEIARLEANFNEYEQNTRDWTDENLSDAYLRGIKSAGKEEVVAGFSVLGLLASGGGGGRDISDKAKKILEDYPDHWTAYRVFQNSAYEDFNRSRLPIVRDTQDKIRELTIVASEASYREADTFTRRKMSQEVLNRFADEGITGIRYSNGRTMKIDSYAEMVARTQTKNAWNEASWNRLQQYGQDLVVISVHYPCSDLCVPYQGNIFSISGTSDQYPSLSSAINGGLYHPNCKHTSSGYNGDKPAKPVTRRRNEEMYEAQNQQRYLERQTRHWKRREVGALTEDEMRKSSKKVLEWQNKLEEHVNKNDFLRLKTDRVTIGEAIHPRQRYKRAGIPWKKSDR